MLFITEQQMWSRKLQLRYYGVEKTTKILLTMHKTQVANFRWLIAAFSGFHFLSVPKKQGAILTRPTSGPHSVLVKTQKEIEWFSKWPKFLFSMLHAYRNS